MKRNIITFAFAIIAIFSANASSFYLHFARPANYTVSVDGFTYQVRGTNFQIPLLGGGRHTLVIASFSPAYDHHHRPMPVVLFNGVLPIREHSDMFASIDANWFHVDRVLSHRQVTRSYYYRYNERDHRYNEENDNSDCRDGRECNEDDHNQRDRGRGNNNSREEDRWERRQSDDNRSGGDDTWNREHRSHR